MKLFLKQFCYFSKYVTCKSRKEYQERFVTCFVSLPGGWLGAIDIVVVIVSYVEALCRLTGWWSCWGDNELYVLRIPVKNTTNNIMMHNASVGYFIVICVKCPNFQYARILTSEALIFVYYTIFFFAMKYRRKQEEVPSPTRRNHSLCRLLDSFTHGLDVFLFLDYLSIISYPSPGSLPLVGL